MHCLRFCERNFQDHDMPVCFSQSDNKAQGVSKIPVANSKASSCMKLTKQLWVQPPSQSMCCNVALLPWLVEVETATDEMYDLHGPGIYALRRRARKRSLEKARHTNVSHWVHWSGQIPVNSNSNLDLRSLQLEYCDYESLRVSQDHIPVSSNGDLDLRSLQLR